eukprot:6222250-Prymnesium_polylepis.1
MVPVESTSRSCCRISSRTPWIKALLMAFAWSAAWRPRTVTKLSGRSSGTCPNASTKPSKAPVRKYATKSPSAT